MQRLFAHTHVNHDTADIVQVCFCFLQNENQETNLLQAARVVLCEYNEAKCLRSGSKILILTSLSPIISAFILKSNNSNRQMLPLFAEGNNVIIQTGCALTAPQSEYCID